MWRAEEEEGKYREERKRLGRESEARIHNLIASSILSMAEMNLGDGILNKCSKMPRSLWLKRCNPLTICE